MQRLLLVRKTGFITLFVVALMAFIFVAGNNQSYASVKAPSKAQIISVKTTDLSVTIRWKKIKKVKGYEVYRATGVTGKYKKIKTIKKGSTVKLIDKGLQSGKKYRYKIRAFKATGKKQKKWFNTKTGKWQKKKPVKANRGPSKLFPVLKYGKMSKAVTARTKGVKVPPKDDSQGDSGVHDGIGSIVNIKAVAEDAYIKISWDTVRGATGYEVYRSEDGSFGTDPIYFSSKNRYYDRDVTPGKTYYYKVAAYRNDDKWSVFSDDSEIVSAQAQDASASGATELQENVFFTESGIRIEWGEPTLSTEEIAAFINDEAMDFRCFLYTISRDNKVVKENGLFTRYIDTTAVEGKTYKYRIAPLLRCKKNGYYVDIDLPKKYVQEIVVKYRTNEVNVSATPSTVTPPDGFTVKAEMTSADLSWREDKRAVRYNIYRDGEFIGSTIETVFSDIGIAPESNYTYAVASVNASEVESFHNEVTVRTKDVPKEGNQELGYTEDTNITLDYGNTTIHIGQQWSEDLWEELSVGSSGTDYAVFNKALNRAVLDKNHKVLKDINYDEELYFFDTEDYDNFLVVYVANNQIVQWITSREDMGKEGTDCMKRGDIGPYPDHACATFVPYRDDKCEGKSDGEVKSWGVYLGGFKCDEDLLGFHTDPYIDIHKKLGFYAINAFRVARGRCVLKYNEHLDGTGKSFTGTIEKGPYAGTYKNYIYGAQPWAETMNASDRCDHTGPMEAGPLAGDIYTNTHGGFAGYIAHVMQLGENVGFGRIGFGELTQYETSPGHLAPILSERMRYIGIGVSGGYHCEIYAVDIDPNVEERIY